MAAMRLPRFQFGLRTLLIGVTLLCVVIGGYTKWQASIVRERQAWLDSHPRQNILLKQMKHFARADDSQRPSLIRVWLGDKASSGIFAYSHEDAETAARLFPEAGVWELTPVEPRIELDAAGFAAGQVSKVSK